MITDCMLCNNGTPHQHSEQSLEMENAKLSAEIERFQGVADRANKAMEKHMKHNAALEIAIQEAHRDTDKANLQNGEMKETLLWVKKNHPHVWFPPAQPSDKCTVCVAIDKLALACSGHHEPGGCLFHEEAKTEKRVCAKCGNIGHPKPHDEATCDYGNV